MILLLSVLACSNHLPDGDLADRAYVVSEHSNELFALDTETLEAVGSVDTTILKGQVNANHMAMVTPDGSKVYVSGTYAGGVVVVDAATLRVTKTITVGGAVTHASMRPETDELWMVDEEGNRLLVIDTTTDEIAHTIESDSFNIPHNVRFSEGFAYVPSIGGNQISVLDLSSLSVVDTLVASGTDEGACSPDPCGFADAAIDADGVLFASHHGTGRTLVYDTVSHTRLADVEVGGTPWSAFVDPWGDTVGAALVPSWTERAVARVGSDGSVSRFAVGDEETYGVNFSPLAPNEAFVLNRQLQQIQVIDRATGEELDSLAVGGTTETATTAENGLIIAPISSDDSVVLIDPSTHEVLARFEGVGDYPWSAATASGQNYCH